MAKAKEVSFKQLKKGHAWVWVIVYIIVFFITVSVLFVITEGVTYYIAETKLVDEYYAVEDLCAVYRKGKDLGSDDILKLMSATGRSFFICSKDNEIIYENGENTCDMNAYMSLQTVTLGGIGVYADKSVNLVQMTEDSTLRIDIPSVLGKLKDGEGSRSRGRGNDIVDQDFYGLSIPVWIPTDAGEETLFVKANINIDIKDVIVIVALLVCLCVLLGLILLIMLVRVISGINVRKRLLGVFFTDMITKGHNRMWFIIMGEKQLKKRCDRPNAAVLNIILVNYLNYCICHSVDEGEKVLRAIGGVLRKNVGKHEFFARSEAANFAAVIRWSDENELNGRLSSLISQLENIDSEHRFCFHIGVKTIEGLNEKRVRRNIDLEGEYNNACTAGATLDISDDSGISFFDEKLIDDQMWIETVQENQRSALMNEEFIVYYQPKYDPRSGRLAGAEALIRWQSPKFGFVPPGKIIPIFEKNGFITEIDHYMLTHAARDQKRWLDMGLKCVPVSVNVSRAHFIESDLAEQIRDIIDSEGTPHELIEIELTESAFFDDKKAMIDTIEKLKGYGFSVSMDDFGSGYSSLNSLKDMPLDVLKLDAEFFRGENRGERGEIVVAEAIRLAKCLNMRIVAEGVEEKQQVDFLAAQDCDMIQGYYYAKPMPGAEYEKRMSRSVAESEAAESPESEVAEPAESPESEVAEPAESPESEAAVEDAGESEPSLPVEETGVDPANSEDQQTTNQ